MKTKQLMVTVLLLAGLSLCYAGAMWGVKVSLSHAASGTCYTMTLPIKHVSVYNSGSSDVAVDCNTGSNAFDLAWTNGTVVLCPPNQSVTLDYTPAGAGSGQLRVVSNIFVRSAVNTTNTIYIAAY